jgi:hypothetical protein
MSVLSRQQSVSTVSNLEVSRRAEGHAAYIRKKQACSTYTGAVPSLLGYWGNYLKLCERVLNEGEWKNISCLVVFFNRTSDVMYE